MELNHHETKEVREIADLPQVTPEKKAMADSIFKDVFSRSWGAVIDEQKEEMQTEETTEMGKEQVDDLKEKSQCPETIPDDIIDSREWVKKGGSYKEVKENSEGDTDEVHHMPADSASPLERSDGPAIKMEKADHRQTASCGNSREAREYRAQQQELIMQGNFREALQMDIDDIRDKFGNKYDDAIAEMMAYVDKLEKEGKVNG